MGVGAETTRPAGASGAVVVVDGPELGDAVRVAPDPWAQAVTDAATTSPLATATRKRGRGAMTRRYERRPAPSVGRPPRAGRPSGPGSGQGAHTPAESERYPSDR